MKKNQQLLTISAAAKYLGVDPNTLRRWDQEGRLPSIRIGVRGDRRYKQQDLEQVLKQDKMPLPPVELQGYKKWLMGNRMWIGEAKCYPFAACLFTNAAARTGKIFNKGYKYCTFFFENNYAHQFMSVEESINHGKAQLDMYISEPEKMDSIIKQWDIANMDVEKVCNEIYFLDFRKLSQGQLVKELMAYNEKVQEFWTFGMTLEGHGPFIDQYVFSEFLKEVKDKKLAKRVFPELTLPAEKSFQLQEHTDLLKIATTHVSLKDKKILLKKPMHVFLAHILENNKPLFDALTSHQQKYYWIQNTYADWHHLQVEDFASFLRDLIKEKSFQALEIEYEKIENDLKDHDSKQKALLKKLELSEKMKKKLEFVRFMSVRKDERKRIALIVMHPAYKFQDEFSRRTEIPFEVIGNALFEEIPDLLSFSFPIKKLYERKNRCVEIAQQDHRLTVFSKNDALELKKMLFKAIEGSKGDLRGMVACYGGESQIMGKAKVILNPVNATIKPDEILITSMTRPEFLPLMKIAKGVVTNEGGITCHAAIVSRELNKPCIIGTERASYIFKDGDEIIMRMNHGLVELQAGKDKNE